MRACMYVYGEPHLTAKSMFSLLPFFLLLLLILSADGGNRLTNQKASDSGRLSVCIRVCVFIPRIPDASLMYAPVLYPFG